MDLTFQPSPEAARDAKPKDGARRLHPGAAAVSKQASLDSDRVSGGDATLGLFH